MSRRRKKLEKISCEVCGLAEPAVLEYHHIIERTNPETTDSMYNLAIICSVCHSLTHLGKGRLKLIGIFPSTKLPYGRTLVYEKDGVCNVPAIIKTERYKGIERKSK